MLFNQPPAFYTLHNSNSSQCMIDNVKYVGYHDLNQSKICNINAIGIEIEIDDERQINCKKYPKLFNDFETKYGITMSTESLSAILPFEILQLFINYDN